MEFWRNSRAAGITDHAIIPTMSAAVQLPERQYMLLENISWETYERLLREAGERHVRMTYDNGDLEIMTLSFAHENAGEVLAALILLLALELGIAFTPGGSTTLRRKLKRKGLEPDKCFWFQHERAMQGKAKWKAEKDPPPDLALEIDISRSSLNRASIYAALRVPEVWRYNRKTLRVFRLTAQGTYQIETQSGLFPFLPVAELVHFVKRSNADDHLTMLQHFREWVRAEVLPRYEAWKQRSKKNGR